MKPQRAYRRRLGFSLLETLVVIAIIATLFALTLPTYSRAIGKARDVAGTEAMRQMGIGRRADNANGGSGGQITVTREMARHAFRREVDTGKNTMFVTELVCMVTNEAEFEAYWHTLINPRARGNLEINDSTLFAQGPSGDVYGLPILHDVEALTDRFGSFPVVWDFLSTNLSEMSTGNIGMKVLYSGGHVEYLKYPGGFPAVPIVAELGHAFMGG